jgi:ribosomal-protein-serine acetyltransferase
LILQIVMDQFSGLLLDLPLSIKTQRLVIRPVMPGDGKEIFAAIEKTRETLGKWLPWVHKVRSWEDTEKTAREFYAGFILREKLNFALFHKGHYVGSCGINGLNWDVPSAHIGYWCRASAQGKGFCREGAAALTLYAFQVLGLKRLTILCDDRNHKSAAIPEALGYELETRALGLLANEGAGDLTLSRRYVRFSSKGLEDWNATWC